MSSSFKNINTTDDALKRERLRRLQAEMEACFQSVYNIDLVRQKLGSLVTFREKYQYLLEMKYDFLQNRHPAVSLDNAPFVRLIELEMKLLEEQERLGCFRSELSTGNAEGPGSLNKKLKLNLSVAQIAFLFRILLETGLLKERLKTDIFHLSCPGASGTAIPVATSYFD